jgi:hypothetical protein
LGRASAAGGREERWAQHRSLEVSQALSQQQRAEPAQAQGPVEPLQAAGLVRERSSQVAAQRAAAQHLEKRAAQHNRTAPPMRRLRLLK